MARTRKAIRITGAPQREEIPEYPDEAVREAIVNAIAHRDYAAAGNVQVRIYPGRLEVWNPGSLPYSVEKLYETHASQPRNRKLADAVHRAGLIEQWGTGTLRIIQACEAQGLARPKFRQDMGSFIVTLVSSPSVPTAPERDNNSTRTERHRRAIAFVREHGAITSRDYQALFGVKDRQARSDLRDMVARRLLTVQGKGPSTLYREKV